MFFEGGTNSQIPADAGDEANLDTQFAFGLSFPIPVRFYVFYLDLSNWYFTQATFYSTAGSPPFIFDDLTPTDTNEYV